MESLRRTKFRLSPGATVGIPLEEADHVGDDEVEQAVAVPVSQYGIAVTPRVAVVRTL